MDSRHRDLVRQLQATGDPIIAKEILLLALRSGRWVVADEGPESSARVAALRFLAWMGWREALDVLASLPLENLRRRGPLLRHKAKPFTNIGPHIAREIPVRLLAAAASSACMTVAHLVPIAFDAQEAISAFGSAFVQARQEPRPIPDFDQEMPDSDPETDPETGTPQTPAPLSELLDRLLRVYHYHPGPLRYDSVARDSAKAWGCLLEAPSLSHYGYGYEESEKYANAISCSGEALDTLAYRELVGPDADYSMSAHSRAARAGRTELRKAMIGPTLIAAAALVS